MKPKVQHFALLLLVVYFCMGASCDKYRKAGELAKDVAAGVLLAQQSEIALHKAGRIDDETHKAVQLKFSELADAGIRLDKAINEAHSAGSATQALQASINAVQDLSSNGVAGIKDAGAKAEVQAILLTVQVTLNNIAAFAK
jgi:hypothetical protein